MEQGRLGAGESEAKLVKRRPFFHALDEVYREWPGDDALREEISWIQREAPTVELEEWAYDVLIERYR